jgi:hypothetical protein
MMCRKASDYLLPGAVRGYSCAICGEKLQVSREGQEQLRHCAMLMLCNRCVTDLLEKWTGKGPSRLDVVFNQTVQEQAAQQGIDLEQHLKGQTKGRTDEVSCALCGRKHIATVGEEISCPCGFSFKMAATSGGV